MILIVGLGSIGERHLRNLRALGVDDIGLVRSRNRPPRDPALANGLPVFSSLDHGLARGARAVVICNPTRLHVDAAMRAARAGCHLFIEKPLGDSMSGVRALGDVIRSQGLVALVGYNLRFHPAVRQLRAWVIEGAVGRVVGVRAEVGQYLPDWHAWEDYREGYSANRALGGGVLLDLIHDIDYVDWVVGPTESVFCLGGKYSRLQIDTEDIAAIVMRCEGAPVVELHLDYLQRAYRRTCQVIGEEGTILWDDTSGCLQLITPGAVAQKRTYEMDRNETFLEEMRHFLACMEGRELPAVTFEDGARSLRIALAARESMESGRLVRLADAEPAS